jgi:hypothetical protein
MKAVLLVSLIAGLALGIFLGVGVAAAQGVTPTPTLTPTSSWPSLIETPTPYVPYGGGDYTCPVATAVGWGTVTPSTNWLLSCWRCLATPTPSPTMTPTPTVGPGTPTPFPPTATPLSTPTATPVLAGSVQLSEYGDTPDCSSAVYYWERHVVVSGPGAKWPSIDGRLYGCGPYPRSGTLHYVLDIRYNNPYGGSVCLGFSVDGGGSVGVGCISDGTYHFEGDLTVSPGGYWWPGKLMQIYNYNSSVPCSGCDNLSYSARLVVTVLERYRPTPTPTPVPTSSPSYCSRVDPGPDLSSYFDFAGLTIVSQTCYNLPADLPGSLEFPTFRLCFDEVRIGDVRIAGYVIHLHYLVLGLVAVLLYRFFLRV